MKTNDWLLIGAWILYLVLVGPFLISARDTLLVIAGLAAFVFLVVGSVQRVKHHINRGEMK